MNPGIKPLSEPLKSARRLDCGGFSAAFASPSTAPLFDSGFGASALPESGAKATAVQTLPRDSHRLAGSGVSIADLRQLSADALERLGQQSLREHILAQAVVAHQKHGPLTAGKLDVRCLIDHTKTLDQGVEAFELAARKGTLKVLVEVGGAR